MSRLGGLKPPRWIEARQVDLMPGLLRQLLEILQLGATVAFPERVDIVDVTNDLAGLGGEVFTR